MSTIKLFNLSGLPDEGPSSEGLGEFSRQIYDTALARAERGNKLPTWAKEE